MLKQLKNIILFSFIISLTACSYSPDRLKDLYKEFPTELAKGIKESVDLNADQSKQVDDYTVELAKWHRRNKLPVYSQYFARLAQLTQQDKPAIKPLQQILTQISKVPHIEEARHLSPKMAAVGRSLSNSQIAQLEKSLNSEIKEQRLEIKNTHFTRDIEENITTMFGFLGIKLNREQVKIVTTEAKNLHDIRYAEAIAEQKVTQQLIALLKRPNDPQFVAKFSYLWNNNNPVLPKADAIKQQQNRRAQTVLMQKLIMSFSAQQKNTLVNRLLSISQTFSEMANE